jgi:hypothetical protein
MLSWFALCYFVWFAKVYAAIPDQFAVVFPLVNRAFPFVLYVLKDAIALNAAKQLTAVKEATRYATHFLSFLNKAKSSASSFMDTLKGFLNKDSSSEDELVFPPMVSLKFYPQSQHNAEINSVTAICAEAKLSLFSDMLTTSTSLSDSTNIQICRTLMKEIVQSSLSQESLRTTSFLLELLAEWYSNNLSIIKADWEAFSAFFTTVFSNGFKDELQLSAEPTSPKKLDKKQTKVKYQLRIYSLCLFTTLSIQSIELSPQLPHFLESLSVVFEELQNVSLEIFVEIAENLLHAVENIDMKRKDEL